MKSCLSFSIPFLFCYSFFICSASGYTDHLDPPIGSPHRNSGFHNASNSVTVIRDWIFPPTQSKVHPSNGRGGNPPFPVLSPKPRSVSLPLYGSVWEPAYWFTELSFGSPHPQVQSLMVDTGSSVVGFPCSDCQKCGTHRDSPYNRLESRSIKPVKCRSECHLCATIGATQFSGSPSFLMPNSSLSHSEQCAYQARYTEGSSVTGTFYEDVVSFRRSLFDEPATNGSSSSSSSSSSASVSVSVPFGCHSKETELFHSQEAAGVLGMEAKSRFGPVSFVTSVLADFLDLKNVKEGFLADRGSSTEHHTQTSNTEPVFAMCCSQHGGVLTIGASDSQYHTMHDEEDALAARDDRTTVSTDGKDEKDKAASQQSQQSQQPLYNPSMKNLLQWTPFVVDPEEEGGWPGSYLVILQGWTVKGTAHEDTVLEVPSLPLPLMTRTSQAIGYPALVDSGTTSTFLPFLLYSQLLTSLLNNVAAATLERRQRVTESHGTDYRSGNRTIRIGGIRKVSGSSLTMMQEKLGAYIEVLIKTMKKTTEQNPGQSILKSSSNVEHRRETATTSPELVLDNELKSAEGLRQEMEKLSLLLAKVGQLEDAESAEPMDTANRTQSGRQLRRLVPVSVPDAEKECWFLPEGEKDLSYFPDMVLQFANHMDHVWRPTSYLFREGETQVYCLGIMLDNYDFTGGSALDNNKQLKDIDEERDQQFDSRSQRREKNPKRVVLGTTFFIDHDIVFHLGRWEMGSREARCPSTDIKKR